MSDPALPGAAAEALEYFGKMIDNCLSRAEAAKKQGKPVVGIMCEYTPRELILAAGGLPVCLCGGSNETIRSAEEILPANLCPLIKSTFGYHVQRSNPFLEMADLLVAETTCDGKKKMYELMAKDRPMHVLELPQKQDSPEARQLWRAEVRKLKEHIEGRFRVRITDQRIREAADVMNRERSLRRSLAGLMKADNPPITGRQLLQFKSSISGFGEDMEWYSRALDSLRSASAASPGRKKVRVLLTGVPVVHGAERVIDIIENSGGLIVCMENCTGIKPISEDMILDDAADPLDAMADYYFRLPCSVQTVNNRRLELLRRLAGEYRPQCVIELIWQACLTYDVEAATVKRFVTQELRLPYLRIGTDYSPGDSARITVRVEAIFESATAGGKAAAPIS